MKQLELKAARRPIKVVRDENGTPHIYTSSWSDALYGLGYMHGVDRGTQLLFSRTVASGRATEEISDTSELLETDLFFRRIALYRNVREDVRALHHEVFVWLTSYCEGVNDGLKELGRSWPMWATSYAAQPWQQESILLIGKLLSFGGLAVSQMQNERLLIELIHSGVDETALKNLLAPRLGNLDFEMVRRIKMANQLSNQALEMLTDLPRLAGSNAWAVSPARSVSGSALLASDPHLEVNRLPAIWYECVLNWDDQYVMGATLPGCPLFAVGRTRRLSWGVTYMKGDTVDYFIEDCRQAESGTWEYRRAESWLPFDQRIETLERKSGPVERIKYYENAQGIIDSDLDALGPGLHLSISWTGNYPGLGNSIGTWMQIAHAPDAAQAMDIVRECAEPTLRWVFADRDGHIGLQACGRYPQRGNGHLGLAPIPAWDPANHWQGWLPTSVLPRVYDPPEGYVVTANEEDNPISGPWLVTQPVHNYRQRRAAELLSDLSQSTLEDMQRMQHDLVSIQARELLDIFLPHMPESKLKQALESWDYRYAPESRVATLFLRLYRNVMFELLGHDRGIGWRRMVYLCTRIGYSMMILTAADRLLEQEESIWWAGRGKGDLIRRAAERLADEPTPPWSEINNFHFTDRFFGNWQVGRILGFESRQYPMPGNHATLFQGHVLQTATRETTFAPSYHFVTDMGTDEAWTNMPGGPSENRFSRWYKSDVNRWLAGDYKRLAVS